MTDLPHNDQDKKPFLTPSTGDKLGVSPREGVAPAVEPEPTCECSYFVWSGKHSPACPAWKPAPEPEPSTCACGRELTPGGRCTGCGHGRLICYCADEDRIYAALDSSMPAGEISRVPYATDERDPETLQRISEPCPKCGSSGRVAEGQGVYWTCGKWYPSVSRPGGEPMTATRGNCDEVAALREELRSTHAEREELAQRLDLIHQHPEGEDMAALRAERDTAIENEKNAIALAYQYRAEVERMRPVVDKLEAALRQYANFQRGAFRDGAPDYVRDALAAVDALRAAQEAGDA